MGFGKFVPMNRRRKLKYIVQQHPILVNALITVLSIGLTVSFLELLLGYLNARNAVNLAKNWHGLNRLDPDFGYKARANDSVIDNCYRNGVPLYSVVYSTDAYGHRVTPVEHREKRHKFLALFGCSMVFGLGVNDDQTIAACLGRCLPDYMPYNFAYQGYGAQQMLLTLQGPIESEIQEKEGVGIYVFIMAHVNRAVGGMNFLNNWGRDCPCYYLDGEELKRNGSFATAHPWRLKVLRLLGRSETLKYCKFTWPLWTRRADVKLTARIIQEAEKVFHQKWPTSPFYVVLYPTKDTTRSSHHIKPFLDEYGLRYIECPDVFDGLTPVKLRTVDGGHPSAIANEIFAERLVEELGLTR